MRWLTMAHIRLALGLGFGGLVSLSAWSADLSTITVKAMPAIFSSTYEGHVEAVQQTTLAAQVPGLIQNLHVQAGQRVRAGQVLLRIDGAAAKQASVAANEQLNIARADVQRKRKLHAKGYISQVALDHAQAMLKAAQAQAVASRMQSNFYTVKAPYAGVVSRVMVEQGETAMPSRPLLHLYVPDNLRVIAAVPASVADASIKQDGVKLLFSGIAQPILAKKVELLPTVNPQSLTRQIRVYIPQAYVSKIVPGSFARVWVSKQAQKAPDDSQQTDLPPRFLIPADAVVRRSEVVGVYVVDANNRPRLRMVRLGQKHGNQVEVLSGLEQGERIAQNPLHAAGMLRR